jgi:RNA polymerase sigma factor (sigma-70 family)
VAEAFSQALRRGSAIRSPLPWIWRAAFRIAKGELKERRRQATVTFEETYEMEDPAIELIEALGQLPAKQRAALVLYHIADYPVREVALITGSTAAAVRMRLTRARRRLRQLLGEGDA